MIKPDIVSRLRGTALDKDNFPRMDSEKWLPVGLAKEAADEIERLRKERPQQGGGLREALAGLVALMDGFEKTNRNQQDAYYSLVKGKDAKWQAARDALSTPPAASPDREGLRWAVEQLMALADGSNWPEDAQSGPKFEAYTEIADQLNDIVMTMQDGQRTTLASSAPAQAPVVEAPEMCWHTSDLQQKEIPYCPPVSMNDAAYQDTPEQTRALRCDHPPESRTSGGTIYLWCCTACGHMEARR